MDSFNTCYTKAQVSLLSRLRTLWEQHVFWTRSFIISTASELGDLDVVTKRLLRNPADFAEVFAMFYDNETAQTFQELLTQHLLIGADLVNAAKNNDMKKAQEAREKWYQNADEIAVFLAETNPYWDRNIWQTLLYDHLEMTEKEAVLRLSQRYEEDVAIFDIIEREALEMADYMFHGFISQFDYK